MTGGVCKHQAHAADLYMGKLSQVYRGSPEERRYLLFIARGGKQLPPASFFEEFEQLPVQDAPGFEEEISVHNFGLNDYENTVDFVTIVADPGFEDLVVTEINETCKENSNSCKASSSLEERREMWDLLGNKLIKECDANNSALADAFAKFIERGNACRTANQRVSFLSTANPACRVRRSFRAGTSIPVQPLSVNRRKEGRPRGRAALIKGVKRINRRKHNLKLNIDNNQPNAKIH